MRLLRWVWADLNKPWGTTLDFASLGVAVVLGDCILLTAGAVTLLIVSAIALTLGVLLGIIVRTVR